MKKEGVLFLLAFTIIFMSFFVSATNCGGTTACSCGNTLTSSRTLNDSDTLIGCPANGDSGLIIGANNIVLDCAGYKINQSEADGGSAINNQGYDNVTIKNCLLQNFYRTILLQGSVINNTLYNNTILDSGGMGMDIEQGPQYNNISYNTISNSDGWGIYLYQSDLNTFEGNNISETGTAFYIAGSASSNSIYNNSLCRNLNKDFDLQAGTGNTGNNTCFEEPTLGDNTLRCTNYCAVVEGVCGNVISQSTNLTTDLSACAGSGIKIGASDITLDCKSYSITGNSGVYGIYSRNYNGLTIKNCNISGFQYGVATSNVSNSTVRDNILDHNDYGLQLYLGSYNNITNNSLSNETNRGLNIASSHYNNVVNNSIDYNYYGFTLQESENNTILNNSINHNSDVGFNLYLSNYNYINGNNICLNNNVYDISINGATNGNYGSNIYDNLLDYGEGNVNTFEKTSSCVFPEFVQGQCGQLIGSNLTLTEDILSCTGTAINVRANDITIDCQGHTIGGDITDADSTGIYIWNYNNTIIKNCTFDSIYTGIYILSSYNNHIYQNNFTNIYYTDGTPDTDNSAVYLGDGADNNLIENNTFTGDHSAFYLYYADNNIIKDNHLETGSYNYAGSSCPFLYTWNGTAYEYISDMSGLGTMSIPMTSTTYKKPVPNGYLKVASDQLFIQDGRYNVKVTEEYDEIGYIDSMQLITVDHSPDVDIYPGYGLNENNSIFSVNKTLTPLVSCTLENGGDCLSDVSSLDRVYSKQNGYMLLNLGDLSGKSDIKLVVNKYVNTSDVKKGIKKLEVKNAQGNWVSALTSDELSIAPTVPNTFVINLTGKFVNGYEVKLTFPAHPIDYLAVDTTPEEDLTISRYYPESADLHYRGYSENIGTITEFYDYYSKEHKDFRQAIGNFTKYGDVSDLLSSNDDKFVIINHGDEMNISFSTSDVEAGKERDFVFYSHVFYKPSWRIYGHNVEPLPFNAMTNYPYSESESYPDGEEYQNYLSEWNTRDVASSSFGASLPYSVNNTVTNNTIIGFTTGIYLMGEENTSILYNNISDTDTGINVYDSTGTILRGNNIWDSALGVQMDYSEDTTITYNIFNVTDFALKSYQLSLNSVFLKNKIYSDSWIFDAYSTGIDFNTSTYGNAYYFANGTPSWEVYDFTDGDGNGWADGGDVPVTNSLGGTNVEWPSKPIGGGGGDYWNGDSDLIEDGDYGTGGTPLDSQAYYFVWYDLNNLNVVNATTHIATDSGFYSADLVPDCVPSYNTIYVRYDLNGETSTLTIRCMNQTDSNYIDILALPDVLSLNETNLSWNIGNTLWFNGMQDWHPCVNESCISETNEIETNESLNDTVETEPQSTGGSYTLKTYTLPTAENQNGNNFNLYINEKIKFVVKTKNHTATLNLFNSTRAIVTLQSDPIIVTLKKGIEEIIDIDKDNNKEVLLRYDGIVNGKASIFIQEIVKEENQSNNVENSVPLIKKEEKGVLWRVLLSIGILITIAIIILLYKKNKHRRYYHRGY